ncbi:MAG: PKD domain-containing protein, partial [Bacteroidota bacterium]|nr:PKD domain-containing protein [Bacteroidota bacterium]
MKKLYTFLFATFFTAIQLYANIITVKGHVKQTNGNPVANTEVKIAVYLASATLSCSEQSAITNSEGFFSKELSCSGDIVKSRVTAKNCDGTTLTLEKEVPVSKIVEANFSVCIPAPPVCSAKFTTEVIPASSTVPVFSAKFNSNISEVGHGDNIAHRTWEFHDGSPSLFDRVDPVHSFPHAGTYEVCLIIKTALGCESRVCKQITVQATIPVACAAHFTFEKLGPKKFRFNSISS